MQNNNIENYVYNHFVYKYDYLIFENFLVILKYVTEAFNVLYIINIPDAYLITLKDSICRTLGYHITIS